MNTPTRFRSPAAAAHTSPVGAPQPLYLVPVSIGAAPAAPVSEAAHCDAEIRLHAEAHNALAMALRYIREPQANVAGATRKAVQALAALHTLRAGG